jgi:hypothetical protein
MSVGKWSQGLSDDRSDDCSNDWSGIAKVRVRRVEYGMWSVIGVVPCMEWSPTQVQVYLLEYQCSAQCYLAPPTGLPLIQAPP